MAKKSEYTLRQEKWLADNNVVRGTQVRVEREAFSREDGWKDEWVNPYMGDMVGKTFSVLYTDSVYGICLPNEGNEWVFPFFVLSVV